MSLKSLGILGGTFDPPHYGHLVLAENAYVQLQLEHVLFVPVGQQPLKSAQTATHTAHRVAMVELVVEHNPAFALSRVDLDRPGPHYTVDMLTLLRRDYPEAVFFFLLGEDSLAQLLTWRDPAGILQQAKLAAMRRPGYKPDMETLKQALPDLEERLVWLDVPHLDISGTDLRRRVREGLPLRYLVPPLAEAYIRRHRLYRGGSDEANPMAVNSGLGSAAGCL